MTRKNDQAKPRVRWTLLVLVCIWALCNFMVIDLFLNVPEFDGIRPRAKLYRAMRYAGHEMVGEPSSRAIFVRDCSCGTWGVTTPMAA